MHVVVSLGTGKMPIQEVKFADLYRPEGILDVARVAFGVRELVELLVDQVRLFLSCIKRPNDVF